MVVIVQEYGSKIGKKGNCLWIKNSKDEHEICADQVKELHVYPACNLSSDAIELCMKKDIWILFVNQYGEPEGEIQPFSGGCSPLYKRSQLLLTKNQEGLEIVKGFLCRKIENRVGQLKRILRNKRNTDTVLYLSVRIRKMEEEIENIKNVSCFSIEEAREMLQGFEGTAGRAYFESISYLMPDGLKFTQRCRNAGDVYNCVLNYLYGIMYAKIKKLVYKCRLDPYIGIMHVDSYNKPTFVFDFIETQRIICEELAYELCCRKKINNQDVERKEDGGLLISNEARKRIASCFYDKMDELCYYKKKRVTQERRMYLELLEVAQRIGEVGEHVLAAV